jgi:carboxylesterase type B
VIKSDVVSVSLTLGPLRGKTDGVVASFLGVPFSEPPLGPLRLSAPKQKRPWTEALDATRYARYITCYNLFLNNELMNLTVYLSLSL